MRPIKPHLLSNLPIRNPQNPLFHCLCLKCSESRIWLSEPNIRANRHDVTSLLITFCRLQVHGNESKARISAWEAVMKLNTLLCFWHGLLTLGAYSITSCGGCNGWDIETFVISKATLWVALWNSWYSCWAIEGDFFLSWVTELYWGVVLSDVWTRVWESWSDNEWKLSSESSQTTLTSLHGVEALLGLNETSETEGRVFSFTVRKNNPPVPTLESYF